MTRNQTIIVGAAVGLVLIIALMAIFGIGFRPPQEEKTVIKFWGLDSDKAAWESIARSYASVDPAVVVEYTGLPESTYETTLLDALAAGTGPDIFLLRNDWFQKHKNKIVQATEEIATPARVFESFPQVVTDTFVTEGFVWALPVSIDTLALVYNIDIFDNLAIPIPPTTWDEVRAVIPKIRSIRAGSISRSAIALGGSSKSVRNADDILQLLMMQFNARLTDSGYSRATFASREGEAATEFYMSFSNPRHTNYTWEESFANSVVSFAKEQVAMAPVYFGQVAEIKAKNPDITLGILPFPQFNKDAPVNFPRFFGLAVSNKTRNYRSSWDFINFITTNPSAAFEYSRLSGQPPALRSVIAQYLQNPTLKVFASQALSAKSWREPDSAEVSRIFNKMIESILGNRADLERFLRIAEDEVSRAISASRR